MDYFSLGSKLDYPDLNALVYLLRKFKRLTSDLTLGSNRIESDYGVYNVTGGLTSVGGNFILEDDVTISSSDVLLNCFYTFYFTVVDVNLSGTVNRRVVSVTGDTGDNGELSVVLSPDLLESDEVILPKFKVDIVFDEHEYYTPVSVLDVTLEVDKSYVSVGESNTVTATVLDDTGTPVEDLELQFNFNGNVVSDVTDSDGVASASYTGTGAGWINVSVMGQKVKFYDGEVTIAEFTGNSIRLGVNTKWLITNGDVMIDWGDGTQSTVNNPTTALTHNYSDGEQSHNIVFIGEVTVLGGRCFGDCTGLTSIVIPSSVTSLGTACFYGCDGLTSVVIPSSVTSLGHLCFSWCDGLTSVVIPSSVTSLGTACFRHCDALVDYELYWTGDSIITYDSTEMPNNTNTIYTIPYETTNNYISKNYPSNKLRERGLNLQLTTDKPIIQNNETSTITATLTHETTPLTSKTLNYQIKHGSTIIDSGTDTTDNNGQITIQYTGTEVGKVDVIVSYGSLLSETYDVLDAIFYDDGVSGTNTKWDILSVTKSLESNGLKFLCTSDSFSARASMNPIDNASAYDFDAQPMVFEFDLVEYSGSGVIQTQFLQNQPSTTNKVFSLKNSEYIGKTIKIIYTGSKLELYINDSKSNEIIVAYDTNYKIRVGFAFSTTNDYLIVKNVKAYPI